MKHNRRGVLAITAAAAVLASRTAHTQVLALPRVRRDIATTAGRTSLALYAQAVAYMQALPPEDPRSWASVTAVHQRRCPHQNWYLLPWHREYLRMVENIIRSLPIAGAGSFGLPYWNWTRRPDFPVEFFDGALAVANRAIEPGAVLPAELTSRTTMNRVYAPFTFERFGSRRPAGQDSTDPSWLRVPSVQGPLEATPHNGVHNWIGGDMRDTTRSPRDPIFFLHHANVDRVWQSWSRLGRLNSLSLLWRNMIFAGFHRPTGLAYSIPVGSIGVTSYDRYDTPTISTAPGFELIANRPERPARPPRPERPARATFRSANTRAANLGQPVSIPVDLDGQGSGRTRVRVLDVPMPTVENAPFVRVFMNRPDAGPGTPTETPGYLGTISFFGSMPDMAMLSGFEFAGTPAAGSTSIQIVPVALGAAGTQPDPIQPALVEVDLL